MVVLCSFCCDVRENMGVGEKKKLKKETRRLLGGSVIVGEGNDNPSSSHGTRMEAQRLGNGFLLHFDNACEHQFPPPEVKVR